MVLTFLLGAADELDAIEHVDLQPRGVPSHIPQPLLRQSWSTGWSETRGVSLVVLTFLLGTADELNAIEHVNQTG